MNLSPQRRLGLSRERRIKQRRDFLRIRRQGRRLTAPCLVANWVELPPGSASKLGVITHRKVGGAVARSRARRLLREAWRRHQFELRVPLELVLVAKSDIDGKLLADVEQDLLRLLRQARLISA